jgi:2-haloacid dehalogenase
MEIFDRENPAGVIIDVNETLFSLDSLQPLFDDLGISRADWFARTLRTGFALTCMGEYRRFPEVARETLRAMAPDTVGPEQQDLLMAAFAALDPHSEVASALSLLKHAKVPVVTLSVGNATNVERLFHRSGLRGVVREHLSCEAVKRWKPAPEPYLYACDVLGLPPQRVWMVAAHSWDIGGAAAAGLRTAWISRLEGSFDSNFRAPDVVGTDLVDAFHSLLS